MLLILQWPGEKGKEKADGKHLSLMGDPSSPPPTVVVAVVAGKV